MKGWAPDTPSISKGIDGKKFKFKSERRGNHGCRRFLFANIYPDDTRHLPCSRLDLLPVFLSHACGEAWRH
jgi:hypothetical protein